MFMYFRSSRSLIIAQHDDQLLAFNYLTKDEFIVSDTALKYISHLGNWKSLAELKLIFPNEAPSTISETIFALAEVNAIIEKGSSFDENEIEIDRNWGWSTPAALLHFSTVDNNFMTIEEKNEQQRQKIKTNPSPELLQLHSKHDNTISLPIPDLNVGILSTMARRRTNRDCKINSISLAVLTECLFSGLGVTGETDGAAGKLPLSMTPSGGARNPYEAFVFARRVDGLKPGFYHYSAQQNSLKRTSSKMLPSPSSLMAGQEWTDDMPCIIFLCAMFERSMWKYDDNNAYRVVLIEAGHIGQNIMLVATQHGLSACPSAALYHSKIHEHLDIHDSTHSVIYALALCEPDETMNSNSVK